MAYHSTEMGGPGRAFPTTRWSAVFDARDPDSPSRRRSLEDLARIYWRPVYAHFRTRWSKSIEESKDLTQSFFLQLTRQEFLDRLDPRIGRFRAYVRAALDNFARREHRDDRDARHLPLVLDDISEPSGGGTPEQVFVREWARSVMSQALDDLERESRGTGREIDFLLLLRHDVRGEKVSYEDSAETFGIKVTDVNNSLYRARRRYRELLLERIRETTSSEEDARREFLELFQDESSR